MENVTSANAQNLMIETDLGKVQEIAREATIWAFPMVENYQSIYNLAIDPNSSNYKGPMNQINNVERLFTPADTAIITPNADTPYSYLIMDLRAEPLVVTLPPIDPNRYYSLQLVDLYTFNFDYLGTRVEENYGGAYLIAGPDWEGEKPETIKRVIVSETKLVFAQFRTQLFNPDDLERVIDIQHQYHVQTLSNFLATQPPEAPPEINYPPIVHKTLQEKLDDKDNAGEFFNYVNFLLQFCPTHPSEVELRERLKTIGIEPGAVFPPDGVSQDWLSNILKSYNATLKEIYTELGKKTSSAGMFGTREELANDYFTRAMGAAGGIYGNSDAETIYPSYLKDQGGNLFDSSTHNYTLKIPPEELPAKSFWSITMYDGNTRFLVDNPIDRYLINSPMWEDLKKDDDGGATLYLQYEPPGTDKESNWLPAPNGLMSVVMRLYIPEPSVLDGTWEQPSIVNITIVD